MLHRQQRLGSLSIYSCTYAMLHRLQRLGSLSIYSCTVSAVSVLMSVSGCSSGSVDRTGPTIISTSPADGTIEVELDIVIGITFDRDIDPTTLTTDTVVLMPNQAGTIRWDAVGKTLTFRSEADLDPETTYTVTVNRSLASIDGNTLSEPFAFSFKTRQATVSTQFCGSRDTSVYVSGTDRASVVINGRDTDTRTYTLTTTADLRDNEPPDKRVSFAETPDQMILRTGHDVFDALFAMAIEETRQNSVSSIADSAFNDGAPVPCECFETGAKWTYVWTRDTAYAVDLALGLVDPTRSKNSLLFKLSERKTSVGGGDMQIVQDTGSGGSYPVSSDRVVWALGAREVLALLSGDERESFRDTVYQAVLGTTRQDRAMVYDPRDGLYRGEQSFLDWREQSYPTYAAQDTTHIAMSKTLSTNVGHLQILRLTADLAAELQDSDTESNYRDWASHLARSIHDHFWLDDVGQYSSMKLNELDDVALRKYDLLGASMAILAQIPNSQQRAAIVSGYPRSDIGPPVIWPQQPLIPIYHNRGMWPFVTAYSLLAARAAKNAAVFDRDIAALVRGAALNLSNMENFDFATGANWTDDGPYSGPVVNSRRQLWSVAGYISMVVKAIFGLEIHRDGIRFQPMVTRAMHRAYVGDVDRIHLQNIPYLGKRINVELLLPQCPDESTNGYYAIGDIALGGESVGDRVLSADELSAHSTIAISLLDVASPAGNVTVVPSESDFRDIWAPREPTLSPPRVDNGRLTLDFHANGEQGVVFNVYRNGAQIAAGLDATTFTDPDSGDHDTATYCYAVEAEFQQSGHRSHHSPSLCYWGAVYERIQQVDADAFTAVGGTFSTQYGRPHYEGWGYPGDTLEVTDFQPSYSGDYWIQLEYGNGAGPVDTGITTAVKWIVVEQSDTGTVVDEGPLIMPHRGDWSVWALSTLLPVNGLDATRSYRVLIRDGLNMSYLDHFARYNGSGGGPDPFNHVNITAIKFLAR